MKTNMIKILLILTVIGSIFISFLCCKSFIENNDNKDLHSITGKVCSYNYNQKVKNSSYYFEVENNNEIILLEIYSYNIPFFDRNYFEQNYSPEIEYTFLISKKDYENSTWSFEVFGVSYNNTNLLNVQHTIKSISINLYLKLFFSVVLLILSSFLIFIFCKLKVLK